MATRDRSVTGANVSFDEVKGARWPARRAGCHSPGRAAKSGERQMIGRVAKLTRRKGRKKKIRRTD
jgi:hypothetical protein